MTNKKFKRALVVEPNHDFSLLLESADRIEYILSGYEEYENLSKEIKVRLDSLQYDPLYDVIVPVGRVVSIFMLGVVLGQLYSDTTIHIAVFRGSTYEFITM